LQGRQEEFLIAMTPRHTDIVAHAAPALLADALGRFGSVRLRVTGTSMRPAIAPGDLVRIERCAPDAVQTGDVVAFVASGRVFVHRLLEIQRTPRGSFFVTRGDSNPDPDPIVHESQLLGRVVCVVHATDRHRSRWATDLHGFTRILTGLFAAFQRGDLEARAARHDHALCPNNPDHIPCESVEIRG
jgi:signal peptidase I